MCRESPWGEICKQAAGGVAVVIFHLGKYRTSAALYCASVPFGKAQRPALRRDKTMVVLGSSARIDESLGFPVDFREMKANIHQQQKAQKPQKIDFLAGEAECSLITE